MDELSSAIPGSEGFVEVEQNADRKQPNEFCLNCGTKLEDTFCHHCGQKDIPKRQTLGELWTNFISSFWSYEGKFFLTTRYLITKPGFLALEYNEGKRESYYHPARMYVFISFVFFLLFSYSSSSDLLKDQSVQLDKEDIAELKKDHPRINIDSIIGRHRSIDKDTSIQIIEKKLYDSIQNLSTKKRKNNGFSIMGDKYESLAAYDSTQNSLLKSSERFSYRLFNSTARMFNLLINQPSRFSADKEV